MADSQTSAPQNGRPDETRSYWALTVAEFRRNRIALVSLALIWFVATVAVFAPLIANARPYYITMIFEDEYDEAYFIVLDSLDRLLAADDENATIDLGQVRDSLRGSLEEMKASLPPESTERLTELSQTLLQFARDPSPEQSEQFEEALAAFETEFDLYEVSLVPTSRWPAFRTLRPAEIAAMLLYVFFFGGIVLRRPLKLRTLWRFLGGIIVPTILGTIAITSIFPTIQDPFPYRDFYEAEDFEEQGGFALPAIVPYGENENFTAESRQPPTFLLSEEDRVPNQHFHLMGTDTNGRSVLARMVYGARISMLVGIVAVSIYVTIGIVLGALAGYFGGKWDILLSRLIEVVICFPALLLILSVQAFLPPSILNIMVALGLISWTGTARLQRGEFLKLRNNDFVAAIRVLGGSHTRIIFRHILPNAIGPILVVASFGIAGSILVESALSFLGFGVPQPTASWGDLLNNGRNDIQGTWWLTVFPGIAIFLTVTCFNLVGDGIRDALDPRRAK